MIPESHSFLVKVVTPEPPTMANGEANLLHHDKQLLPPLRAPLSFFD
jgi:hypothetical protein